MIDWSQNEELLPGLQRDLENKWAEIGTEDWELFTGSPEEKKQKYWDSEKFKALRTCSRCLQGGDPKTWEGGICPVCGEDLPKYDVQLHHVNSKAYFHETLRDVRLIHRNCHSKIELVDWVPPSMAAQQNTPTSNQEKSMNPDCTPSDTVRLSAEMITSVCEMINDTKDDGSVSHTQIYDAAFAVSRRPEWANYKGSIDNASRYACRILSHFGIIRHMCRAKGGKHPCPSLYQKTDQVEVLLQNDLALKIRLLWLKREVGTADKNMYPPAEQELAALGFDIKKTRPTWENNRKLAYSSTLDGGDKAAREAEAKAKQEKRDKREAARNDKKTKKTKKAATPPSTADATPAPTPQDDYAIVMAVAREVTKRISDPKERLSLASSTNNPELVDEIMHSMTRDELLKICTKP